MLKNVLNQLEKQASIAVESACSAKPPLPMMTILTIDTGTTNTRVSLWRGGHVLSRRTAQVGVRDTAITGNRTALQNAVRDTIAGVLQQAEVEAGTVGLAVASGMITSPLGLYEVPHLTAPVGLDDLAQGMVRVDLPEVFAKPIWFVPGVRNQASVNGPLDVEAMDMMRGEEVEVMGLLEQSSVSGPAMLVLPGSHTKFISLDRDERIAGCATTLAGELLQTITQNTILAQALDRKFAAEIKPEMVLAGAAMAQRTGLGRTCFSIRTLDQFLTTSINDRANFLLGAVLSSDMHALKNSSAVHMQPGTPIVLAGNGVVKQALALLIAQDEYFCGPLTVLDDEQQALMAGQGAIRIALARGLCVEL